MIISEGMKKEVKEMMIKMMVIINDKEIIESKHFSELFFRVYLILILVVVDCEDGMNLLGREQGLVKLIVNSLDNHQTELVHAET
jgi:hypothetical protein